MALVDIKVPDIGDFDEVTVIELLVKPGDTVKPEQSLLTVESDKASMEIPSSHGGVVKELRVKLGDKVKEGSVVLVLEAEGAAAASAVPAAAAPAAAPAPASAPAPVAAPAPAPAPAAPAVAATKVTYAADAFFDFNKSALKPEGRAKLDDLVGKIKGISLEVIIAVGHTDSVGSDAYNQKLSVKRAEAVKAYLVTKGIEKNRVYTEGKGEKQPVADNKTSEGRAKNRRVEIEVVGTRAN